MRFLYVVTMFLQTCVCADRIFIHDDVYEEFVAKLEQAMKKDLKVGDGSQDGVTQGPLINQKGLEKVRYCRENYSSRSFRGPSAGILGFTTALSKLKFKVLAVLTNQ